MPLKLKSVKRETKGGKEYVAIFDTEGKEKKVRFGTKSNWVNNPQKTKADWDAYHARHSKVAGANYNRADTAASLSRYILWGKSRSLSANVSAYKRKYGV